MVTECLGEVTATSFLEIHLAPGAHGQGKLTFVKSQWECVLPLGVKAANQNQHIRQCHRAEQVEGEACGVWGPGRRVRRNTSRCEDMSDVSLVKEASLSAWLFAAQRMNRE